MKSRLIETNSHQVRGSLAGTPGRQARGLKKKLSKLAEIKKSWLMPGHEGRLPKSRLRKIHTLTHVSANVSTLLMKVLWMEVTTI